MTSDRDFGKSMILLFIIFYYYYACFLYIYFLGRVLKRRIGALLRLTFFIFYYYLLRFSGCDVRMSNFFFVLECLMSVIGFCMHVSG
jgi:hypothetical protein